MNIDDLRGVENVLKDIREIMEMIRIDHKRYVDNVVGDHDVDASNEDNSIVEPC